MKKKLKVTKLIFIFFNEEKKTFLFIKTSYKLASIRLDKRFFQGLDSRLDVFSMEKSTQSDIRNFLLTHLCFLSILQIPKSVKVTHANDLTKSRFLVKSITTNGVIVNLHLVKIKDNKKIIEHTNQTSTSKHYTFNFIIRYSKDIH